jgi:hypothetical protein
MQSSAAFPIDKAIRGFRATLSERARSELTLEINLLTRRLNPRRNVDFHLQLNHLSVLHSSMSITDEPSRRPFAGGDASRAPRSHPGSLVTVQSAENRELGR